MTELTQKAIFALRRGETVLAKHSGYTVVRLREESHINKKILSNVGFQMDLVAWATTPCITQTRAILSKGLKDSFCHCSRSQLLRHLSAEAAAPPLWRRRTRSDSQAAGPPCAGTPDSPRGGARVRLPALGQPRPRSQRDGPAARQPRLCLTWVSRPPSRKEPWRRRRGGRRKDGGRERGTALPRSGPRRHLLHLLLLPPSAASRGGSGGGGRCAGLTRCPGALRARGGCGTARS